MILETPLVYHARQLQKIMNVFLTILDIPQLEIYEQVLSNFGHYNQEWVTQSFFPYLSSILGPYNQSVSHMQSESYNGVYSSSPCI